MDASENEAGLLIGFFIFTNSRCIMAEIMDVGGQHKCAFAQCECQVSSLDTYCSDYCSDADDQEEVEVQCDCKHSPCALD
jgi:hypothetical protein